MSELGNFSVGVALNMGNFNKGLSQISKGITTTERDFKRLNVSTGSFEDRLKNLRIQGDLFTRGIQQQSGKIELLTRKQKDLTKAIEKQKQQMQGVEKGTKEYDRLANTLLTLENRLDRTNSEISESKNKLSQMKNEAKETSNQIKTLSTRTGRLKDTLKNIDMTQLGIGVGAVGTGMALLGKRGLGYFSDLVNKGAEYEIQLNAISVLLGDSEKDVRKWAKANAGELGFTENQLASLTSQYIKTGEKMGYSGEEAVQFAKNLSIATLDQATFFDQDPTDWQTKIKSALNGSTEIMDQFGVDITKNQLMQSETFKKWNKTWEKLSEGEKQILRYEEIMNSLNYTSSNAKNEAQSFGVMLGLLKTNIGETASKIGASLLPSLEPLLQKVGEITGKVAEWVEKNPELASKIALVSGAVAGLSVVVGTALLAIGGMSLAIGAIATPVGLVTGAIVVGATLLAGAFALAWAKSEKFRDIVSNAFSKVKEVSLKVFGELKNFVTDTIKTITTIWGSETGNLKKVVSTALTFIKTAFSVQLSFITGNIRTAWIVIKGVFKVTLDSILSIVKAGMQLLSGDWKGALETLQKSGERIWNTIKETTKNALSSMRDTVKSMGDKIKNALTSPFESAMETIGGIWDKISGFLSKLPGINKKFSDSKSGGEQATGKRSLSTMGEPLVMDNQGYEIRTFATPFFTPLETLSTALESYDYSGAMYQKPATPKPKETDSSLMREFMGMFGQFMEQMSNQQERPIEVGAQLYVDGARMKTRMDTIEKRKNRLSGK